MDGKFILVSEQVSDLYSCPFCCLGNNGRNLQWAIAGPHDVFSIACEGEASTPERWILTCRCGGSMSAPTKTEAKKRWNRQWPIWNDE